MNLFKKTKLFFALLLLPVVGFCQEQVPASTTTYFSNVLFLTLLVIIISPK